MPSYKGPKPISQGSNRQSIWVDDYRLGVLHVQHNRSLFLLLLTAVHVLVRIIVFGICE